MMGLHRVCPLVYGNCEVTSCVKMSCICGCASPTEWTRIWVNSSKQWRTEEPVELQSMGVQQVGHDLATEQQQICVSIYVILWYIWHYMSHIIILYMHGCCLVAKLCLILCNPMDNSPLGSSVHGIFQGRILEWVAISFSRGSSSLMDWTYFSCIGRQILYHWATREVHVCMY